MSAKFRSFLVLALTVGMIKVSALPLESQSIANRGSTHSSFPLPHNVTGQDEPGVWGGIHVHDPSIIEGPDGSYYSFTTHDLIAISRAPSLDGYWDLIGSVLDSDSVINLPGRNDTWAPDVHKVGDTYFLYYSVSEFGSQDSAIGLATSKTLLPGSWTDHGQIIRSGNETGILLPLNITNAIDPNLFIDPKTNDAYLSYGSFFGDIWQFRLKEELTAVTYTPPPVQVSLDPAGTRPEEGSFLSYHDGYYYLWYSHGICCGFNASALPPAGTEYSIRVGRSTRPTGPFIDSNGTALLNGGGDIVFGSHDYVYAPGGQGVFSNCQGRDVLYYHYIATYKGYSDDAVVLGYNFIDYSELGWPSLVY